MRSGSLSGSHGRAISIQYSAVPNLTPSTPSAPVGSPPSGNLSPILDHRSSDGRRGTIQGALPTAQPNGPGMIASSSSPNLAHGAPVQPQPLPQMTISLTTRPGTGPRPPPGMIRPCLILLLLIQTPQALLPPMPTVRLVLFPVGRLSSHLELLRSPPPLTEPSHLILERHHQSVWPCSEVRSAQPQAMNWFERSLF